MNNFQQEFRLPPRPSKPEKPVKLINELRKLSKSIICNCQNNQLETASDEMTLLSQKLDEIDDSNLLSFGTGTLREIVSVLLMIQSANRMAVSKGMSAMYTNHSSFNI
ncbi:MAG: hypothetical protein HOE30_23320 [Deltaproteobacteria bacterium]|jgi:hypothetical protein|nr:hypothetical protein [Deltaproteobacteria bacterium]MBT4637183.1 hypothetical protein [Deltaproteobacteria bacterium]